MNSIGFIGGGRVTRIILQGFKNKNLKFEKILIYEPDSETLKKLEEQFSLVPAGNDLSKVVSESEILFLAVHPPVLPETLTRIKPYLGPESVVISLAPKITISMMSNALDGFKNIARMNPSANSILNQGINPISFSAQMNSNKIAILLELLKNLGSIPVIEEKKIEAYAVINAMGSTYFWFQLQQLKELGLKYGLSENELNDTIPGMMTGTVNTLFKSGLSPELVMDLVPVKPLSECEETIKNYYVTKLDGIFEKIRPQVL